jgi:hypothetical protein
LGAARTGHRGQILTWTDDNLLRQVVYEGLREDEPAVEVCRQSPHPKSGAQEKPALQHG